MNNEVTQELKDTLERLRRQRSALDDVGRMTRDELEELTGALQTALTPFLPELVETPAKPYDLREWCDDGRGFPILFRQGVSSELTLFLIQRGVHSQTGEPISDFVEVIVMGDSQVAATLVHFREVSKRWKVQRIVEAVFDKCRRGLNGTEKTKAQMTELVERLRLTRRIIWDHYLTVDPKPREERTMNDEQS